MLQGMPLRGLLAFWPNSRLCLVHLSQPSSTMSEEKSAFGPLRVLYIHEGNGNSGTDQTQSESAKLLTSCADFKVSRWLISACAYVCSWMQVLVPAMQTQ
jgi:hypothetical protein